ncbi:MAG: S8 family serine peptidase [Candidatus Heimdallarchaeota archaeon]|nr:S8 family serine peptidase [Candidatus Heimdallarchaeota archaeon]MCK4954536.1 S8 family serine peptidase [Candidatus Heimdallarchaeota archaeon]
MKRKILHGIGIILLTILMIQLGSILSPPARAVVVTTQQEQRLSEANFIDTINRFVMHFESRSDYNEYIETHSTELKFPNLKMVIIDDWKSRETDIRRMSGVDKVYDITNKRYYFQDIPKDGLVPINLDDVVHTIQTKDMLNVQPLWDLGYFGADTVIYDIDTGINTAHVDFTGRINLTHSLSFVNTTYGYGSTDMTLDDNYFHGTATAGIAAGDGTGDPNNIGMAPSAQIIVGKVSNVNEIRIEALIAALEYGLYLGNVDVINYSIGGTDFWGMDLDELLVRELTLNGVIVSCSAGNEGEDGYYSLGSPGSSPQSISVAATNLAGSPASFSSFGPTNEGFAKPDLAAPGKGIMAPNIDGTDNYEAVDGTSFSAPHITGVSALLIDAMKGLGTQYDVGLIKAALMKSADPGPNEYLHVGAGFPDVGAALNLIQTAPINGSGFASIMWAIPEFPISAFATMPQGFHYEMFVSSVSSTPWNDLTPLVTGNISSILTLNTTSWTGPWAKNFFISVDVPVDATLGVYEGYINYETAGGVTANTHIKITVTEGKARILFPWFLNEWSIDHFLGQYKFATQDLLAEGIAVNEYAILNISGEYSKITPELLATYDAVWLADVFDYQFDPNLDPIGLLEWRPNIYDEITAIQQYVENGGSLLVDINGPKMEDVTGYGTILAGTNSTFLNEFLDPFGIAIPNTPHTFAGNPVKANIISTHAITEDVDFIDHWGTTLTVTSEAKVLARYTGGDTVAVHENAVGGRVVVVTTNFFMDTSGYLESYNAGTQNALFTQNIFHWLIAEERLTGSYILDDTGVSYSIKSFEPSAILTATVSVGGATAETVTLTDLGAGDYSYRMDFDIEGKYVFKVESADDKYLAGIFYDADPPVITHGTWVNNTKMDGEKIDFTVQDTTTNIVSISVTLNGDNVQTFGSGKVRTFIIFKSALEDGDNILHVVATDAAGNKVDEIYVIPTKAGGASVSTLAAILGLLSIAALVTLIRRKRR